VRRRQLILGCGGAAIAWPIAGYSQQPEKVWRIGVLTGSASNPQTEAWFAAFRQKLRELGRIDGGNIRIDLRWGSGDIDRIRADAAELVNSKPDVILCQGARVLKTFQAMTRDIPVVFVATSDPVAQGFVESFSHPGGNLTGFTQYEFSVTGKLMELLKEVAPGVARVALLFNSENTSAKGYLQVLESVAPKFGVILVPRVVRDAATIEDAISRLALEPNGALLLPPDATTRTYRNQIIALAERHGLPSVYSSRADVEAGGLISYGPDLRGQFRGAATYVDRILKGETPADLPVQAPTEYELFVNLKTARKLSLTVPQLILARADEVIE
jgi:putative ABC transport system substrate-binding protein